MMSKGLALQLLRKLEQSELSYNAALALDPGHLEARKQLATLHYETGRFQDAIDMCELCLQREASEDLTLVMACCCHILHQDTKALAATDEVLASSPKRTDALAIKALALSALNRSSEAHEVCNQLIELRRGHATVAHLVLGDLSFRNGRIEEAINEYSNAIQLAPQEPHAYANRGLCKCARGEFSDAIIDLSAALVRKSALLPLDRSSILLAKSLCCNQIEDHQGALKCINEVLKAEPSHANARAYRAVTLGEMGNYDEMKKDIETLLESGQFGDMPAYCLAVILLQSNEAANVERAILLVKQLVEKGTSANRSNYRALLVKCYERQGDSKSAKKVCEDPKATIDWVPPRFEIRLCNCVTFDLTPIDMAQAMVIPAPSAKNPQVHEDPQ